MPAYIYGLNGNSPTATPIATGTMTVGPNAQFYTANFSGPVQTSGIFYIGVDSTNQDIVLSDLSVGSFNLGFWRTVRLDLSTLAGLSMNFRWRFATDAFLGPGTGWFVDDVRLDAASFECTPPVLTAPGEASLPVLGQPSPPVAGFAP